MTNYDPLPGQEKHQAHPALTEPGNLARRVGQRYQWVRQVLSPWIQRWFAPDPAPKTASGEPGMQSPLQKFAAAPVYRYRSNPGQAAIRAAAISTRVGRLERLANTVAQRFAAARREDSIRRAMTGYGPAMILAGEAEATPATESSSAWLETMPSFDEVQRRFEAARQESAYPEQRPMVKNPSVPPPGQRGQTERGPDWLEAMPSFDEVRRRFEAAKAQTAASAPPPGAKPAPAVQRSPARPRLPGQALPRKPASGRRVVSRVQEVTPGRQTVRPPDRTDSPDAPASPPDQRPAQSVVSPERAELDVPQPQPQPAVEEPAERTLLPTALPLSETPEVERKPSSTGLTPLSLPAEEALLGSPSPKPDALPATRPGQGADRPPAPAPEPASSPALERVLSGSPGATTPASLPVRDAAPALPQPVVSAGQTEKNIQLAAEDAAFPGPEASAAGAIRLAETSGKVAEPPSTTSGLENPTAPEEGPDFKTHTETQRPTSSLSAVETAATPTAVQQQSQPPEPSIPGNPYGAGPDPEDQQQSQPPEPSTRFHPPEPVTRPEPEAGLGRSEEEKWGPVTPLALEIRPDPADPGPTPQPPPPTASQPAGGQTEPRNPSLPEAGGSVLSSNQQASEGSQPHSPDRPAASGPAQPVPAQVIQRRPAELEPIRGEPRPGQPALARSSAAPPPSEAPFSPGPTSGPAPQPEQMPEPPAASSPHASLDLSQAAAGQVEAGQRRWGVRVERLLHYPPVVRPRVRRSPAGRTEINRAVEAPLPLAGPRPTLNVSRSPALVSRAMALSAGDTNQDPRPAGPLAAPAPELETSPPSGVVQREPLPAPPPEPEATPAAGAASDLDDLARQVYPLIKRLLAVERERGALR